MEPQEPLEFSAILRWPPRAIEIVIRQFFLDIHTAPFFIRIAGSFSFFISFFTHSLLFLSSSLLPLFFNTFSPLSRHERGEAADSVPIWIRYCLIIIWPAYLEGNLSMFNGSCRDLQGENLKPCRRAKKYRF